jgi:hypothetical protein
MIYKRDVFENHIKIHDCHISLHMIHKNIKVEAWLMDGVGVSLLILSDICLGLCYDRS